MEPLFLLILAGVALTCALVGASLASEKGRGSAGFWLGLFFGPIGILIAVLLSPGAKNLTAGSAEAADFAAIIKNKGKVGIAVSPRDGRTVVAVTSGSSAEQFGIRVGDRLITIDGALCEGDNRAVVLRLVGTVGSSVQVSVRRGEEALDFTLVRK